MSLYPARERAEVAAALELESEPMTLLLRENAYREVLLSDKRWPLTDKVTVRSAEIVPYAVRARLFTTTTAAWHAALEKVGIRDFRWRDLRAHLGELAHPAGHANPGVEGTGRLGKRWR